jgi:hypothetical protein
MTSRPIATILVAALLAIVSGRPALSSDPESRVNDRQLAVMMFVDYGRSYGYQTMMARIHLDTVKAELERDAEILKQKEDLFRKQAIPLVELEIAQLKDAWNRKQLIVAEKNLDYVSAEYEAMGRMAKHFADGDVSVGSLYAVFRRGWEAGCAKGPDEVVAMKAWADFLDKSVARARELYARGNESFATVVEREAQLKIARSNYENRLAGLDRCRSVLFPTLDDILAIRP